MRVIKFLILMILHSVSTKDNIYICVDFFGDY